MKASPCTLLIGNFPSGTNGGSKQVCESLAERLEASGYRVLKASARRARICRLIDILLKIFTHRREYSVAQMDVFSGFAFLWAECAGHLLRFLRKPYVCTLHGGSLPEFSKKNPERVRTLLVGARTVTTPSRFLLERMNSLRGDLLLVPNGIDLGDYPFHSRTAPKPKLVWLRAYHEVYNPSLAVRVLCLLKREYPEATLIMAGPDKGGHLARVRELADRMGAAGSVELAGAVPKDHVPSLLNRGDIFLNTTNIDNTPVSVIEAMACGLCIISTNVGGIPYLLADGEDSLLVPPDDPDAMAAAVRRLLRPSALPGHLSGNAHEKAEQFNWTKVMPIWERLLSPEAAGATSQ